MIDGSRGSTTMEALVALGLLGIVSGSLLHTLANSTGTRATSAAWLHATTVGASIVEYLRAGTKDIPVVRDGFEQSWSTEPIPGHPGLTRYQVIIRWQSGRAESLTLEGLFWSRS